MYVRNKGPHAETLAFIHARLGTYEEWLYSKDSHVFEGIVNWSHKVRFVVENAVGTWLIGIGRIKDAACLESVLTLNTLPKSLSTH